MKSGQHFYSLQETNSHLSKALFRRATLKPVDTLQKPPYQGGTAAHTETTVE